MSESGRRTFEISLEIGASSDLVWKALTDARELVRWFPLDAEVEPRQGGRYFISWQNEWQGEGRIRIFEPQRHLRTSWPTAVEGKGGPVELAVDYHIEAAGGRTVLRLVHSGFGLGAEWDDEYDGISTGWNFELRSLRHYLERHLGRDRRVAYVLGPRGQLTGPEVWERVWREGFATAPPSGLAEGARYCLPVGGGETFCGQVLHDLAPRQFAGTVESLGDAVFRVEVFGARPSLWLADWSGEGNAVTRIERRWREMVARLFPASAGGGVASARDGSAAPA